MCDERSSKQWQATIQREMWTLICQDNPLYSTICGTIFWRGVGEERLAFALADHLDLASIQSSSKLDQPFTSNWI